METTLEFSRWNEAPLGVGYRRWVIISAGVRQALRPKSIRILLGVTWIASLLMASVAFAFSQSVASGGWLESAAANFGPRALALAKVAGAVVTLYPDICIGGMYTLIFWLQSWVGLTLTLIALSSVIPQLVTRDRASNALTIYLSRPLTTTDYLLGKLGIIASVVALMWTGPLLCGWLMSLLVAPSRDFVAYSMAPAGRALLFNAIALASVAPIALGISALARTTRNTVFAWVAVWFLASAVANFPGSPTWLKRASFSQDLVEIRKNVFRLDRALNTAAENLPITNKSFIEALKRTGERSEPADPTSAVAGLAVLAGLSSVVFFRKLRSE